jgi:hypothetical protein
LRRETPVLLSTPDSFVVFVPFVLVGEIEVEITRKGSGREL